MSDSSADKGDFPNSLEDFCHCCDCTMQFQFVGQLSITDNCPFDCFNQKDKKG